MTTIAEPDLPPRDRRRDRRDQPGERRAVAHGHGSRKTRASRALPRRLSITSVWQRNFSAIWTPSIVWTCSPRNSRAWTISSRAALVQAEVASTVHRFADARDHLARAALMGGPREEIDRHTLSIDQACGVDLDAVLAARRRIATASGRLEDLVPLGAVLADLERFAEADAVYQQAFYSYDDVSPFPLAWVCFQLGMLWGELVPVPDPKLAALWYRRAIAYLPGLCEGACAPGGDLREPGPSRRRGGATPTSAFEPRSGGPVAPCRCADRARKVRRGARHSSTPHGLASMSCLAGTCSPSRTMPPSSTPAAATITGGRSNSRARMPRIVRHAVRSSRCRRSR